MTAIVDDANALEPRLNQAFVEYAQARGFVVDPARVRRPQDMPRVERTVPFVRRSFFAGETFIDLADAQRRVEQWCATRAGLRVHGTTQCRPIEVFAAEEQSPTRKTPVKVSGLSGAIAVSTGDVHTVALKADGTVWAWGSNTDGRLGDGTTTLRTTPVQVSGITTAVAVVAAERNSYALLADGTVRAWGYGVNGRIGNGSNVSQSTPVIVSGLTGVVAIAGGGAHTLALKSDGTVWSWGYNKYGQLGNNAITDANIPVMATGVTSVSSIGAGQFQSFSISSDGTIKTWGYNHDGELANNTTTNAPVAIAMNIPAVPGTNTATYAYNGDGLRQSKRVRPRGGAAATTAFTWDQRSMPRLLTEKTGTAITAYIYGPGGEAVEQINADASISYLHHDQLGSIRTITNSTGALVGARTSDAYGNRAGSIGTATSNLGYAGEYTDTETGFLYLRARSYDPATGQFIERDPALSATRDAYGYGAGSPLNASDPSGLTANVCEAFQSAHPRKPCPATLHPTENQGGPHLSNPRPADACPADKMDGGFCTDSGWNRAHPFNVGPSLGVETVLCDFVCIDVAVGFDGLEHLRVGFGPAAYVGVGVPRSNNPPCEADQFFGGVSWFSGSVQRSKDPNAPFGQETGPWKPSGSFGPSIGGGFAHWWTIS